MNQPTDQLTNQPTNQPTNLSLFPPSARIAADGHLHLAGLDTVALAAEFGTPLYVYDEATLRDRCCAYRRALAAHYPAGGQVAYAAKAFLCTALAQLVAQEGLHLDVVSGGELHVALRAGFPATRIHLHGNNKSPAELAFALQAGVGRIVVDNFHELESLSRLAAERGLVAPIWLRLSPGVDAHTHAYRQTGLLDSKFGLPIATGDAARAVRQALDSPHLALTGLHAHIGSQIFETAPFVQTVEALLDLAAEMRADGFALRELSAGGGLAVPYLETDPPAPLEPYVQAVSQATVRGCRARGLPLPQLVLEPGRSIVGPAGVALYTVGGRKAIPGVRTYLSVDGGLADNPRPALYGAPYTALLADKADQPPTETVTVAGKFCESGDVLMRDVRLPHAAPDDLLAVPVSGAYQLAMSSNYNQALRPAAVLLRDGQAQLILRRETPDDLARRDLPLDNSQLAIHNSPFIIVGLGEVLWDLLPAVQQLGGAPANFAWHAAALGDRGIVASRVGLDPLGEALCTRLAALNLTTRHLQRDPARPTGTVHVQLDAAGQPDFTVTQDVAWDALAWTPEWAELAAQADAVCFGSLAQRTATSHETVQRFLRATRLEAICLFDVNLRQSYYSAGVLDISLRRATMVKLNQTELPRVAQLLGLAVEEGENEEAVARRLLAAYDLALVCLTRGARGSLLVTDTEAVAHPGYAVQVVDTVGAGDAFAAAVVHHWLRGASLEAIGEAANRLGAYVATQAGATPHLPPAVRRQVLAPAQKPRQ